MEDGSHPFGWLSILPPVVTIVMAIATRKTLPSLTFGILLGSLIYKGGYPIAALQFAVVEAFWAKLISWDKIQVYGFTLTMGALIGLISASGGMRGLVNIVVRFAYTRKRGQITTWLLGLVIFFDDYANMLLLGGTLRPVTDRLRISREKLAYMIDSTAAPVAGLALISTWVAIEIEYIADGLTKLDTSIGADAFQLFIESIPYRFYSWWALLLVPILAILNRDFGPMLKAERAQLQADEPRTDDLAETPNDRTSPAPPRWYNAVVPIVVTVSMAMAMLGYTGHAQAIADGIAQPTLREIVGSANPAISLLTGAALGLVVAVTMIASQRLLSARDIGLSLFHGGRAIFPALLILWLAAGLVTLNDALETGTYLAALVEASMPVWLLPTVTFALAGVIAFCTGTSWGTMGIVMPLAIPISVAAVGDPTSEFGSAQLLAVVGGVLAGAIFGDHCSPISDTTILSSQACGCDHISHVRTQMPYALLGGAIAILCGTLPIGLGLPVLWCHVMGLGMLIAMVWLLGKAPEAEQNE
ncbi:MAG: Na+/H+ antiporter NhaC family protein [Pirellulaceae bacterium]